MHFFVFSFFFNFSFSFIFFHFLSCSFIFFHFLSFSFMFFHVLSCSFMFLHFPSIFHFLSFSFHFLSFSFIFFVFVGCSKSDFFWASISSRFLLTVIMLKINSWGHLGWYPFGPFSFFPTFFLPFFLVFTLIFSFFVHFFIFLIFDVFLFSFFQKKKVSSFPFSCISKKCHCWHLHQSLTVDVSSVVGAPWRCGVLTT